MTSSWDFEFDWLGVDRRGHVAAFITWGEGLFPAGVAQHIDEVDAAAKRIDELPVIGPTSTARYEMTGQTGPGGLTIDAGADFVFYDAYAAKGLYVYHWDGSFEIYPSCLYERYFAPPVLISVSQLPADLQAVARFAEFTVSFADAPGIVIGPAKPPAR